MNASPGTSGNSCGAGDSAQDATASQQTEHGPFACPDCRVALSLEQVLHCPRCRRSYLESDGTACFNDRGLYHGPILPKAEMAEVLALARAKGYQYVLTKDLWDRDPDFARYITEPARTNGLQLLKLTGNERVLDFGCAFGVFSLELARRVSLVVGLDVTREKIQFLNVVKHQENLQTFFPVCNGDPLRLPFPDDFFDWVILNAVFEYLPKSIDIADPWQAHLVALREFRRILKPGGRIYLATKNRYSYLALRGDRDHDGLRFTSILPRSLANWISIHREGKPYRTIPSPVSSGRLETQRRLLALS
jgi:SAM-dependent methyltransferase